MSHSLVVTQKETSYQKQIVGISPNTIHARVQLDDLRPSQDMNSITDINMRRAQNQSTIISKLK